MRSGMFSSASAAFAAEPPNRSPGLASGSRSLSRSWRCTAARSGSKARSATDPHSTSRSRSRPKRWHLPPSSGMPEIGAGGRSVTVLVADDTAVAQRLCRRVLEKAGHKVLTASDGQEAVNIALGPAGAPDMILMDVAMPGMDGLEAMRQIKAQKPGLAIVIASAHSMASDRERFLAAGADEVLSKPFKLTDLTSVVDRLAVHKAEA